MKSIMINSMSLTRIIEFFFNFIKHLKKKKKKKKKKGEEEDGRIFIVTMDQLSTKRTGNLII